MNGHGHGQFAVGWLADWLTDWQNMTDRSTSTSSSYWREILACFNETLMKVCRRAV